MSEGSERVSMPVVVILILEPFMLIGTLGFTSYHLIKTQHVIRQDMAQVLDLVAREQRQISSELRAAQLEYARAFAERFEDIESSLAWMLPWVRYWAARHQQQTGELPA